MNKMEIENSGCPNCFLQKQNENIKLKLEIGKNPTLPNIQPLVKTLTWKLKSLRELFSSSPMGALAGDYKIWLSTTSVFAGTRVNFDAHKSEFNRIVYKKCSISHFLQDTTNHVSLKITFYQKFHKLLLRPQNLAPTLPPLQIAIKNNFLSQNERYIRS